MTYPTLAPDEVDRIVGFLGYGLPSAPIWFVGFEEGFGRMEPGEPLENLRARGKFESFMDLAVAHLTLKEKKCCIDLSKKNSFTQVWIWMAKIVRAHQGAADWNDLDQAKQYVRCHLGRHTQHSETFLTELSPIPSATSRDRKKWYRYFETQEPNLIKKIAGRQAAIKHELEAHRPKLVVCYGLSRTSEFGNLLGVEQWHSVENSKTLRSRDNRFLLLPFFGRWHMKAVYVETLLKSGYLGPTGVA